MRQTFGSILQVHRGVGPGFDFMRLALALSVVLFHSFQISYGRDWSKGPFEAPIMLIVPAFFALSGFLVAGSMVRNNNVKTFLIFRALRIVPALGVEIVLSALILGPLVTAAPLFAYFSDPMFARYFTNVLGIIRFSLPGVFLQNPLAGIVNGQLWTIPSELHCYIALGAAMLLHISARPRFMLGLYLFLAIAESAASLLPHHHYTAQVLNSEEMLVLCFMCGNVFYLWRDKIPSSVLLFSLSIFVFVVVTFWIPELSLLLGTAAATYFITYLGMQQTAKIPVLMSGDYSYGIYLYSFPIQQAIAWGFPDHRTWYFNLVISAPLSILFAAASWHVVEKPSLSLRKRLARRTVIEVRAAEP